jgi:putative membrane protein
VPVLHFSRAIETKTIAMNNRNAYRILLIAAAMFAAVACDDDDDNDVNNVNDFDRQFVNDATIVNMGEIELGALAVERGQNQNVKDFGQLMQTEHQNALNELETIAESNDIDTPDDLDQKHKDLKARLMTLSGYSFDTAYINSQVKGHQEAEALFESETTKGKEERLKNYASKTLPHIRMHLTKADSIQTVLQNEVKG